MDIGAVIHQLKTYALVFNGNIAGAAQFETGLQTVASLPYPSAFVLPLGEFPDLDNEDATGLYQMVDQRFAVVVEVSATEDRRGQGAVAQLDDLRASIFSAILNWHYDPNAQKGLSYVGAELMIVDRARLWYKWEFSNRYLLTDADGFQVTGAPLTDVQVHDSDPKSPGSFDVAITHTP